MSDWKVSLGAAPRDKSIDVVAKFWRADSDTFIYKRFTDVRWNKLDNKWIGIPQDWCPIKWMLVPDLEVIE